MITVVDYGMGNLRSVSNALEALGADFRLTQNPRDLEEAQGIILPGVGAFGEGMENLRKLGFIDVLNEQVLKKKKPYLGICLGLQFLGRTGHEEGEHEGLGWLHGEVRLLKPDRSDCKVPHMGWNNINILKQSPILEGLEENPVFYFVHSYHLELDPAEEGSLTAIAEHGQAVTAAIQKDNIYGVQFHPEKSQGAGLLLLKNFLSLCR